MEQVCIELSNVSKSFKIDKPHGISKLTERSLYPENNKTFLAIDSVSFSVKKGEVLGIIGLNGSGKTTLLRLISGIYQPDSGYLKIKGKLSPLMQLGAGFQADLDCRDNIIINGLFLGMSKSEIQGKVDSIIKFAELEKFQGQKLKHLSSGMRVRLAFSTAIQIDSEIILIDEILSVGDKDFQKKSYDEILSMKKKGKTILHATHSLGRLADLSDRVLLIHEGKVKMIGNPDEVIQKYNEMKFEK